VIKVDYTIGSTSWHINKKLMSMNDIPMMSLDLETKGVYSKLERKRALKLLATEDITKKCQNYYLISNNSGLSYPSLVNVTHFVFGISKSSSIILIPENPRQEIIIWKWIVNYQGKLLVHNTLFDLKVMYHRTHAFPKDYEDTALRIKTLINNSKSWKAKIGLKDLMGSHYSPKWTLIDEYEPDNPKEEKFLRYAAIDGAATYYLWNLIKQQEIKK